MSEEKVLFLFFAIIMGALVMIWLIIDTKNISVVLKNSERIRALNELNKSTAFNVIQLEYQYHQVCNSKRQFDSFLMDDYLIGLIDSNEEYYRNIVQSISSNIKGYSVYLEKVNAILMTEIESHCCLSGLSTKQFVKYEKRIFKSKIMREPQMNITIICKATYISPKGRNQYSKEQIYNYTDFIRLFEHTQNLKAQRKTRQYQIKLERAKMTDSLRYEIFKRDNFRCQICGSTAQDGVKLHVDHIVPISKGGLTVESNLRTLCDRCNMGKSDKV